MDPATQMLVDRLEQRVRVASARIERDLDDGGAWDQLFDALVDSGRIDEALCGLELATEAGVATAERYIHLAHTLRGRGERELAYTVAALAAHRFADEPCVWVTVGYLCLEAGDEARAERAYLTAERVRLAAGARS